MSAVGRVGWLAGAMLVTTSCVSTPGSVEYGHYKSKRYPLQVVGNRGASQAAGLMAEPWKLENFYGSPMPEHAKQGDEYKSRYRFDADGDGETESYKDEFAFELRFENLHDKGSIWLRVVPASRDSANVDLKVLLDSFVDSLAGGNYETVLLTPGQSGVREKRYASTLTAVQPCRLAQRECLLATIELADVDQLKLSPSHRWRKVQILLLRPGFMYEHYGASYPTYFFAGYSSQPERFAGGLPDFHDLLSRILIDGRKGLELASPPPPATPPAPAPAPAPTPATAPPQQAPAPISPPPPLQP